MVASLCRSDEVCNGATSARRQLTLVKSRWHNADKIPRPSRRCTSLRARLNERDDCLRRTRCALNRWPSSRPALNGGNQASDPGRANLSTARNVLDLAHAFHDAQTSADQRSVPVLTTKGPTTSQHLRGEMFNTSEVGYSAPPMCLQLHLRGV